jgi:predicted RNA polymerase sigma factor
MNPKPRVEDLLREVAPQVLAVLVRRFGDFDAAEDAVQEALLAAATRWPADGIPDNPRGWLIQTGSRKLVAVRAHLHEQAGHPRAAIEHYRAAAARTTSVPEQRYLTAQVARLKAAVARRDSTL